MKIEPRIHGTLDELPGNHPFVLKSSSLYCENCNEMIWAFNNECMQTWVESGKGNFCITCFAILIVEYEDKMNFCLIE